jgi:hypothetical protein
VNQDEHLKLRLSGICERLEAWNKRPWLSIGQIQELTGLSRARVRQQLEHGQFVEVVGNGSRCVLVSSVLACYKNRVAKLLLTRKRKS